MIGTAPGRSRNFLERLTRVQFRTAIAASCLGIVAGGFLSEWPVSLLYPGLIGLTLWSKDGWMPIVTAIAASLGVAAGAAAPLGPVPIPWALTLRAGGAVVFLGAGLLLMRHRVLLETAREREGVRAR